MLSLFTKKEINTSRQYNLDLLKAFAIICMIICHPVLMLGAHHPGYENDFWFIFGDEVLGSYMAVAHAFMFAMGFGFIYSRKNSPLDLLKRGIKIFILGFVLNFFRYTIYILIGGIISGELRSELWYSLFCPDILQFAGLAMMFTSLLKKLKLNELWILVIAFILSCIGSPLAGIDTNNTVLNYIIGTFISTNSIETSCFNLFNWYLFVAFGMFFASVVRRIQNTDKFYKIVLLVSAVIMILYITLTFIFGKFFLSKNHVYYAVSPLEAAGLLSIDLTLLSLFYFLLKVVNVEKLSFFTYMSKRVNRIYIIHWLIIGFVDCIFGYLLELNFTYPFIYAFGIVLIFISTGISKLIDLPKKKS